MLHVAAGVYFDNYAWWWLLVVLLTYLFVLAAGSYFIQWNFYLHAQNRLPLLRVHFDGKQIGLSKRGKQVALSFDDGPALMTPQMLDILKKEGVPATFFLIGKNIVGNESILQRMLEEGHSIGNHSYYHKANFDWQSKQKMLDELIKTNEAITKATGKTTTLFRPPYGVTNPNLARAVKAAGLRSIGWTLRSYDTVAKGEDQLLEKIIKKTRPGSIILLHDRCSITAAILPRLIQQLQDRGYHFTNIT